MPVRTEPTVLTKIEAEARTALLAIDSYDVSLDLTATPVRSRTVVRFRCARPGAESFADLAAPLADGGAVLNGVPLRPVRAGLSRQCGRIASVQSRLPFPDLPVRSRGNARSNKEQGGSRWPRSSYSTMCKG